MNSKLDPDDEYVRREFDFSNGTRRSRFARRPGERTEIFIDGAVAYQLRLIPGNKVLARFASTLEAWPAIIEAVERGRSPRTLSLDWVAADGAFVRIAAGPWLETWARLSNGETPAGSERRPLSGRRVAERASCAPRLEGVKEPVL